MGALHRTQVLLEDWHYAYLKNAAERDGKSLSEILRGILSDYVKEDGSTRKRLEEIAGIGADEEAIGREHDRWLYKKD